MAFASGMYRSSQRAGGKSGRGGRAAIRREIRRAGREREREGRNGGYEIQSAGRRYRSGYRRAGERQCRGSRRVGDRSFRARPADEDRRRRGESDRREAERVTLYAAGTFARRQTTYKRGRPACRQGNDWGPANTSPNFINQCCGEEGQLSNPEQNEIVAELAGPSHNLRPATSKATSGNSSLSTSSS